MRKNLKKLSQITLLLSVFIASMLAFEANSQTVFTFDTTDFTIVNRTFPNDGNYNNPPPAGGSFWYGQMHDSLPLPNGRDFTGYQLTDTFQYQSVALWHSEHLDLSKDFVFKFRVNFGNRITDGGDGVCFVLHQMNPVDGLIGIDGGYIGYGYTASHAMGEPPNFMMPDTSSYSGDNTLQGGDAPSQITPSFAIEFDSYIHYWQDDTLSMSYNSGGHISYLKNGNMLSHNGNAASIYPDGFSSIKDGAWHCINIVWYHTDSGYNMVTYFDGDEKMRRVYNSISSVVSSASETNSIVRWGITSATGSKINRQMMEFVSMESGRRLFASDTATIRIENTEPIRYPLGVDTIFTACESITLPSNNVTIYYPHPICSGNPVSITLSGLDTAGAEWSVLKGSNYDSISSGSISISSLGLEDYDTIWVRLVLNGDTTYFVFQKGVTHLNNYFKDNATALGFSSGTKKIDTTFQSIPLPANLLSCIVIGHYDTNRYVIPPHIVNGKLEFELLTDTFCVLTSITLRNTCDTLCDMDIVSLGFSGTCPCSGVGFYFEPLPPQKQRLLVDYYGGNILVRTTNGKSIVQADLTRPNGTLFTTYGNGTGSLDVSVSMPCTCDTTTASFPICATLEDSSICCDTVYVTYICCDKVYKHIDTIPTCADYDYSTKRVNITAALLQFPVPAEPLRISICSQSGDEVMLVSNSIPTELVSYFSPSVANLTAGMYYVVFQIAGETYAIQFFKQ